MPHRFINCEDFKAFKQLFCFLFKGYKQIIFLRNNSGHVADNLDQFVCISHAQSLKIDIVTQDHMDIKWCDSTVTEKEVKK